MIQISEFTLWLQTLSLSTLLLTWIIIGIIVACCLTLSDMRKGHDLTIKSLLVTVSIGSFVGPLMFIIMLVMYLDDKGNKVLIKGWKKK